MNGTTPEPPVPWVYCREQDWIGSRRRWVDDDWVDAAERIFFRVNFLARRSFPSSFAIAHFRRILLTAFSQLKSLTTLSVWLI